MGNFEPENIRNFLLGRLDNEAVWQEIEKRLLDDADFAEEVEIYEEELIDEYLCERLTSAELIAFEQHFLASDEMRERLEFARALNLALVKESPQPRPLLNLKKEKKSFFSFFIPQFLPAPALAALTLIFVAIAGFGVWKLFLTKPQTDEGLTALRRVYGNERPFEARIVGFNHAPLMVTRGGSDASGDTTERDRVELILLDAALKQKDAPSYYALGKFYLAEKNFDKALVQFEKAVALSPSDAPLHSDLGAALLESGKQIAAQDGGRGLELFGRALAYSEKAIEINPQMLEPRFNRALCLQEMLAVNVAKEAWREYLQLDSTSPWADEARQNLERLEQKKSLNKTSRELTNDFLEAFRNNDAEKAWAIQSRNKEMINGKLIPQQLAKLFLEASGAEKAEYLAALRFSAELEASKGDLFFANIADFYSQLSDERHNLLKDAQASVQQGYDLTLAYKIPEARVAFANARQLFEKAGNVEEARLVDYWIAASDYELVEVEKAHNRLLDLTAYCTEKNYLYVCSQSLKWLSLTTSARRELSASIDYGEKSLKLSTQLEDLYHNEKTFAWLAEKYREVGQYRAALSSIRQALVLGSQPEAVPRQKARDAQPAAKIFYSLRRYNEALAFGLEWVLLSQQKPYNPTAERNSTAFLGAILSGQKKFDEASEYVERSLEISATIKDERSRKKSESLSLLQLATIERERGNCNKALTHYNQSVELSASLNFEPHAFEAGKGRLLCILKSDTNETEIRDNFAAVFNLLEENRSKIIEEQNRNSFFDGQQNIYDIASDYEFQRGNFETAFDHAETSRSRSLLDLQKNGVQISFDKNNPEIVFDSNIAQPLKLRELQPLIPRRVQIIQYAVLPDKIIIWLVSRDGFETLSYAVKSNDLQEKVFAYLEAIKKRNDSQNQLSAELNRILFQQLEAKLSEDTEICIIPDKFLFHLPFASLVSNSNGKYLIENYKIFYAPSLNTFINSTQNAQKRMDDNSEKLLSVGNPEFDRQKYRYLADLPAAETEASEIGFFYEKKAVFSGGNATKQKVLNEMAQADVIHFAGHYVANESSPLLSSFLITDDGKEANNLTNFELLRQNLSKPRLIVLSACQTEMEGYFNGEGIIGAGRTLLAAGVPLLVATKWQVESSSSAELMIRFHRLRKEEKLSTVAALRQAQIEMLKGSSETFRQPYFWAGFTALGGYAQF
jgi:CHAT domain-containing protein/tetratricopeptide (TPR) repeat protein